MVDFDFVDFDFVDFDFVVVVDDASVRHNEKKYARYVPISNCFPGNGNSHFDLIVD